eukprot:5796972-Lingulodinium_polyedra.AAC.1
MVPVMLPPSPARKRSRPSTTSLTDSEILLAMETAEDEATQHYLLKEMHRREAKRAEEAEKKTAEEAEKKTAEEAEKRTAEERT